MFSRIVYDYIQSSVYTPKGLVHEYLNNIEYIFYNRIKFYNYILKNLLHISIFNITLPNYLTALSLLRTFS